ncbi:MAG TPA: TIGR03086 family protein [Acidimicrobiaceae bacterium]|nr:TIGR03086 family protein [Acidimicrobiaceae bacterium]
MTEVSTRYDRIAAGFADRLAGVVPGQWGSQSPCTEWTAADIVDHVIVTHRRVLGALTGAEAQEMTSDDDRIKCFAVARGEVTAALEDPAQASRTVSGMFGEQPFESLVSRLLCADTLIHSWDLARATGQDEDLDPVAVQQAMEFLGPIDEAIRRPGGFGPKIEPPAEADPQTKLLNFAGRAV